MRGERVTMGEKSAQGKDIKKDSPNASEIDMIPKIDARSIVVHN